MDRDTLLVIGMRLEAEAVRAAYPDPDAVRRVAIDPLPAAVADDRAAEA